ncbi:GTPase HflX [Thermaurantimonas aggregans]|uniref:GTPase HflX n=1 Tax=Thermaurantimonas aggregans TaxID=2173829 RepID=A0A401XN78_9FLAO|nr:GTPase HflX [Thermaurantimonas aggregans]MCX8148485.1 GTPase HflX [Thermaurantimonas aggregans]GCD78469.1 GTPase HflX [Thermaurantimonas aggregans]
MIEQKIRPGLSREKAILVGVSVAGQSDEKTKEYLEELRFLADTAGAAVVDVLTQKLPHPNPATYIGTGKLEELAEKVKAHECNLVIFDDELSATQIRNLERALNVKILDRTSLILDIFATRARTAHARTQVELAQYEYLLPRLTRMWTHLERQKGGIGLRGPGETQIETDRRIIQQKIALLKEKLQKIDRQMATQRKHRVEMVRVALVGYTNVGKSTLMNLLAKANVFAENKLFATLDTTVRKVVLQDVSFLLSDTVGFIRKLPTQLVESFKSTLDEVRESDILLHVVDISHPAFEDHIITVNNTIKEILGGEEKKVIMVFNKIDLYKPSERDPYDLTPLRPDQFTIDEWQQTWMAKTHGDCVFISAQNKLNIDALRELLYREVRKIRDERYPYSHLNLSENFSEE